MPYVVCEEDNRERKSSNQDLNEDTSINRKVSLRYNIHVVRVFGFRSTLCMYMHVHVSVGRKAVGEKS